MNAEHSPPVGKVRCWPPTRPLSCQKTFGNVTRAEQHGAAARQCSPPRLWRPVIPHLRGIHCALLLSVSVSRLGPISRDDAHHGKAGVSYPAAGGHVCDLPGNFSHAQASAVMGQLKNLDWIDDGTRAVMLELSIYSTNENIFAYAVLMIEFWNTGAVQTYPTIATLIAEDSDSPVSGVIRIALRSIIYLYVMAFIKGEVNEFCAVGARDYLCSCWNIIDLLNYTLFVVSFVYWVSLLYFRGVLSGMLHERNDPAVTGMHSAGGGPLNSSLSPYIDVYGVGVLGEHLNVITAINCILSSWKLFAYFRASKKLSLLVSTIFRAAETFAFFIIIIVFLIAYALAFYTAFHNATFYFKSFAISLRTPVWAAFGGHVGVGPRDLHFQPVSGASLLFIFSLSALHWCWR